MTADPSATGQANEPVTVFVVDDDDAMRGSLQFLLRSGGLECETFGCAQDFLDRIDPEVRGCVLLDVRMPGMDGLTLQEHLRTEGINLPVILVTAYGDVQMAVRAMKAGALDFIEKPFEGSVLLERVRQALSGEARRCADEEHVHSIHERLDQLTPREREVMDLVVLGRLNKQIAGDLGISMKTVEIHRARVMEKMQVVSLAELVRLCVEAGVL